MYALKPFIFYHHRAYYARPPLSIMPGRTWRDNGHKALCPLSRTVTVHIENGSRAQQLTATLPYKPLSSQLARSAAPRQCRSGCGGAAPPRPAVHLLSPRAPADLPVKSPVILPRSKRRSFLNSYPPKQRTASQFYGCSSRWVV